MYTEDEIPCGDNFFRINVEKHCILLYDAYMWGYR